jgi:hypothetical protein
LAEQAPFEAARQVLEPEAVLALDRRRRLRVRLWWQWRSKL